MTYEPPPETLQLKAGDLPGTGTPYLCRGVDDDDTAWNLVTVRPICRLVPTAERDAFLPLEVTVNFSDGSVRFFNPDDQILIGPTS